MPLKIYNTLTGKKEEFKPICPGKAGMYVCGPTVYDSCHIGHARSIVVFDVIRRHLRLKNYAVTYIRNFTDVDDKIIVRAAQSGVDCQTLANKYIHEFYADMDALNVDRADIEPRATEHIPAIINLIEKLIHKDLAYQVEGDIYFAVEKFNGYGKLSGRRLEDMQAGARVNVDTRKHNPHDFALWKAAKPGEPSWDSPWGAGRPGWHIECSAMSHAYLGETFDIHGGGKDLIFPHHENEIAQSEGLFEKPYANYWVHNGFVNINHEKMSKSLGNFLVIRDIFQSCHPEALRLFLLSVHYRSPLDFNQKAIDDAAIGIDKFYAVLDRAGANLCACSEPAESTKAWQTFIKSMDDDFNTARGIGILFEVVRHINRSMDNHPEGLPKEEARRIKTACADIRKMGHSLGILNQTPREYFAGKKAMLDSEKIEQLIQERAAARKTKDWAKADQVRDQLLAMNIQLLDTPVGTTWEIKT